MDTWEANIYFLLREIVQISSGRSEAIGLNEDIYELRRLVKFFRLSFLLINMGWKKVFFTLSF